MAISKQLRMTIKRIFWVFVPATLVLGLGILGLSFYLIYHLAHPLATQLYGSPRDFEIIIQKPMWTDEKWKNSDGTQSIGWFMTQGRPGPAVILSHAYGSNRSELLPLSFELWKAGYHVLLYDMRGHGESPVKWSGLGTYEVDDLLSAVDYLKQMKIEDGQSTVDGRVGLYGVDLGGYISIVASSQNPLVKAVAVDSAYPNVSSFIKTRTKKVMGSDSQWANNLVESQWTSKLTALAMQVYLLRREETVPALESVSGAHGRQFLYITAANTGEQEAMTKELAMQTKDKTEIIEVENSRLKRLYDTAAASYDARVVQFFREAIPVAEVIPAVVPAKRTAKK